MDQQSQLAFAVTFDGCMWAGAGAFFAWILFSAVRGLARAAREGWKRIPNADLRRHRVTPDFRVGGDAK